jgi:glycosyltransferase involved in cell wall biosynthesis
MRLLIVSQYFWPENFRINDLAAELSKRGHEVVVLTGLPNYPYSHVFEEFRKDPEHFSRYEGVEVIRVPLIARGRGSVRLMLNYLSFAVSSSILGAWKLRGRNFDVVFTNQLSPVTVGFPAALLARLKKAPMAMWVLDLWPDTLHALSVIRSPRLVGLVGRMVAFIYRRCDLILAQSHSFVPKIRQLAQPDQVVEYFPSWAEDAYRYDSVTPAPEVPLLDGSFDVMFAGNIGESQDFPCILDAAEKLREHAQIRWLVVGDGRMAPWVRQEIRSRELENRVLMLGRYPIERMPSFFMRADALLVTLADKPIFAMTIPGKLQSYLTAGVPIVAALNGEGAELLSSAQAGLAAPAGDAGGLAEAVLQLSRMPLEQRKEMGRNGLRLSQRAFNRQMVIDRIERMLDNLSHCTPRGQA